jgi:hypothetical protein
MGFSSSLDTHPSFQTLDVDGNYNNNNDDPPPLKGAASNFGPISSQRNGALSVVIGLLLKMG